MNGWKRYKMLARRATTLRRWSDVIDIVREFNAYCTDNGWPDWWSDMERMERDAISARVREEFSGEELDVAGAITADGPEPGPNTPEGWGETWV